MKTISFFYLFLLWIGLSAFKNESPVRPNGWYYVTNEQKDSLSADPIVTVKDFSCLRLDSFINSDNNRMTYIITGQVKEAKWTVWAEATQRYIGKQIAFLFKGIILTAPYVRCRIEKGNFQVTIEKQADMKAVYEQLIQEAGCARQIDTTDETADRTSTGTSINRYILISVFLSALCTGAFLLTRAWRKQRKIE